MFTLVFKKLSPSLQSGLTHTKGVVGGQEGWLIRSKSLLEGGALRYLFSPLCKFIIGAKPSENLPSLPVVAAQNFGQGCFHIASLETM